MAKQNCWEFKNCGREPGGVKAAELGVCPATTEVKIHGVNNGVRGGRACWAITGTMCGGKVQGMFAMKLSSCMACEFYKLVIAEENHNYQSAKAILAKLNSK